MTPPPTEPSTGEQRRDAIFEYSQIFQKTARPCFCHRRRLRCHRCFHNSSAADRVGSGPCDSAAPFHGAGPAVVVIAGTGSGSYSGLGRTSILAAGGWSDCCPGHSSAEVRTALELCHRFLIRCSHGRASPQYVCFWAQSRHPDRVGECPLSGVKRTSKLKSVTSAFDPKRTSAAPSIRMFG
jgi:hypothetical protein